MKIKHIVATLSLTFLTTVAWKIVQYHPQDVPKNMPNNKAFSVLTGWENTNLKPSFKRIFELL